MEGGKREERTDAVLGDLVAGASETTCYLHRRVALAGLTTDVFGEKTHSICASRSDGNCTPADVGNEGESCAGERASVE